MVQIPKSRCQEGAVFNENKSINHKLPFPHVFVMLLLPSPGSANGKNKKSPGEASFFVDEMAVQGAGNKNQSWGGVGEVGGNVIE